MVPASLVILNPYTLKFKRSCCDFSKTVPTSDLGFGSAPDPSLILMNWPHSFCHSKVGAHDTHQNNGLDGSVTPVAHPSKLNKSLKTDLNYGVFLYPNLLLFPLVNQCEPAKESEGGVRSKAQKADRQSITRRRHNLFPLCCQRLVDR